MKAQILLRIVVSHPPEGVVFAVQRGRADLSPPTAADPASIVFEFPVQVADANVDPPRLTGEYVQGPPAARFVYVNSGIRAGQIDTCWERRAKVPLTSISQALVQQLLDRGNGALEARIAGKSKDGGPVCASVQLLSGWAIAEGASEPAG